MKILVYGAGVLGSVHAAQLKELGQNVSIPARSRRLADIRHYGIELENSTTGRRTITPSRRGDIHTGRCLLRIEQIARAFHEVVFPTVIRSNMDAWLKTHIALVSPIANAIYMAGRRQLPVGT